MQGRETVVLGGVCVDPRRAEEDLADLTVATLTEELNSLTCSFLKYHLITVVKVKIAIGTNNGRVIGGTKLLRSRHPCQDGLKFLWRATKYVRAASR